MSCYRRAADLSHISVWLCVCVQIITVFLAASAAPRPSGCECGACTPIRACYQHQARWFWTMCFFQGAQCCVLLGWCWKAVRVGRCVNDARGGKRQGLSD